MPRAFGRGPFGVGPYSRDIIEPAFTVRIFASSSVAAAGRLLWATIPVPPCEPWPPIPGLPPLWPPIAIDDCVPWPPIPGLAPLWPPIAIDDCVSWPGLTRWPSLVLLSPGGVEWEVAVADDGALSTRLVRAPIAAAACGPWPGLPGAPPIWAGIEAEDDDWTPPSGVPPAWQPIAAAPCNGWAMA